MSGVNAQLDAETRQAACLLYQSLLTARTLIEQGERRVAFLEQKIAEIISSPLLQLDYAAICNPSTFEEIDLLPDLTPTFASPGILLAVAALLNAALKSRRDLLRARAEVERCVDTLLADLTKFQFPLDIQYVVDAVVVALASSPSPSSHRCQVQHP